MTSYGEALRGIYKGERWRRSAWEEGNFVALLPAKRERFVLKEMAWDAIRGEYIAIYITNTHSFTPYSAWADAGDDMVALDWERY